MNRHTPHQLPRAPGDRDPNRGNRRVPISTVSAADLLGLNDDDCGHHSWAGLMALLDEHWPEDIFPTREDDETRDTGARIVSLIRWVDRLRSAPAAELRAAADAWRTYDTGPAPKHVSTYLRDRAAELDPS